MNTIIQNILAFSAVLLAVAFLIKKFFYKKKTKKACGTTDCGCN
ncbi:FeoB-associated Cys-rich membrane protein [Lacinutrix gracilariae]|uniref:FeoB-associated Cys-rich membrane protein n=1 Tax=Lacinutrix gracilariae TaxID=1747198 RepID=A0ABW5K416_9FLAO